MKHVEIARRAQDARQRGERTVGVLGLGFVGTATAANLARMTQGGKRSFFVVGVEQDSPSGIAKVDSVEHGRPPIWADDPALAGVFATACHEPRNLVASTDPHALAECDVVVCCINLDLVRAPGQTEELSMPIEGYERAMRTIGRHLRPGALVCVESTLPVGLSDTKLYPALVAGCRDQGLDVERDPPRYAYCYERVMPGPGYLDSVNRFPRAYAGIDERSADLARDFLSSFVDVERYPLWRHKSTRAAEMAKLLENSYRAVNIAFVEEWARLAEGAGVDLFDVIHSIRVRKGTHDNLMLPGLGVGGYCLTKDALLAAYGAEKVLGVRAELPFSRRAILTNERMPLRAIELARAHFGGALAGRKAALLGVTYRPGVADTRSSPTETLARAFLKEGASVVAWDPLVSSCDEMPELAFAPDPRTALRGASVVVLCLPDPLYARELPEVLLELVPTGALVIDPWNVVAPVLAGPLASAGVRIEVFGRGDLGDRTEEKRPKHVGGPR
ncbi:MAG: nucleotide sugar dehydrogenase [Planctomycetes bacterium]|nr:nucleotide sugar dehydrogenase [Planctomycetota bacterium]